MTPEYSLNMRLGYRVQTGYNSALQEPEQNPQQLHIIINKTFNPITSCPCSIAAEGLRLHTRCYTSPSSCLTVSWQRKSPVTQYRGWKYAKITTLFWLKINYLPLEPPINCIWLTEDRFVRFLSRLSPVFPTERLSSRRCFPLGGAAPDVRKERGAQRANQNPGRAWNPAYLIES